VLGASFSADGKRVVSASDDGNAIIHAVPTDDELVVLATHSITRCRTVGQREELGLPVVINGAARRRRPDSTPALLSGRMIGRTCALHAPV